MIAAETKLFMRASVAIFQNISPSGSRWDWRFGEENVKKVVTSNPQLVDFKQVKSSGDAFLIATAMKYDLTVITEENKTGQKKIPFVCNSLGVPCVDILGLCEKEGWSF